MQDDWGSPAQGLDEDFGPAWPIGPQPSIGYVICPMSWLTRVLPVVRAPDQLAVALVLYRQCLMWRRQAVVLPNKELARLGVSRYTKYRALALLQEAGAITIDARDGGPAGVTLHWFP